MLSNEVKKPAVSFKIKWNKMKVLLPLQKVSYFPRLSFWLSIFSVFSASPFVFPSQLFNNKRRYFFLYAGGECYVEGSLLFGLAGLSFPASVQKRMTSWVTKECKSKVRRSKLEESDIHAYTRPFYTYVAPSATEEQAKPSLERLSLYSETLVYLQKRYTFHGKLSRIVLVHCTREIRMWGTTPFYFWIRSSLLGYFLATLSHTSWRMIFAMCRIKYSTYCILSRPTVTNLVCVSKLILLSPFA